MRRSRCAARGAEGLSEGALQRRNSEPKERRSLLRRRLQCDGEAIQHRYRGTNRRAIFEQGVPSPAYPDRFCKLLLGNGAASPGAQTLVRTKHPRIRREPSAQTPQKEPNVVVSFVLSHCGIVARGLLPLQRQSIQFGGQLRPCRRIRPRQASALRALRGEVLRRRLGRNRAALLQPRAPLWRPAQAARAETP
jgi:hypothetical protein